MHTAASGLPSLATAGVSASRGLPRARCRARWALTGARRPPLVVYICYRHPAGDGY